MVVATTETDRTPTRWSGVSSTCAESPRMQETGVDLGASVTRTLTRVSWRSIRSWTRPYSSHT